MGIEELAKLAEEATLREMARAHVIEREHNEAPWGVTEEGWVWMMMLTRLAGIGMKDAKFVDILEHARRARAAAHTQPSSTKDERIVARRKEFECHQFHFLTKSWI